jgi:hypothetical protein
MDNELAVKQPLNSGEMVISLFQVASYIEHMIVYVIHIIHVIQDKRRSYTAIVIAISRVYIDDVPRSFDLSSVCYTSLILLYNFFN